jgi:hypothetical protein
LTEEGNDEGAEAAVDMESDLVPGRSMRRNERGQINKVRDRERMLENGVGKRARERDEEDEKKEDGLCTAKQVQTAPRCLGIEVIGRHGLDEKSHL